MERTPSKLPKMIFGVAQPANYINSQEMRAAIKASSLEFMCCNTRPIPAGGGPRPPDGFTIEPEFVMTPPDAERFYSMLVYRNAAARIILGENLIPIEPQVDPATGAIVHPPDAAADAAGIVTPAAVMTEEEYSLVFDRANKHWKSRKSRIEAYQTNFATFKAILEKFISSESMRSLHEPLSRRDPRATWELISDKIDDANNASLTTTIADSANKLDWGVREHFEEYVRRKTNLWNHLRDLHSPLTEEQKKTHIAQMLIHSTGYTGPYRDSIKELLNTVRPVATVEEIIEQVKAEERSIMALTKGNNKWSPGSEQNFTANWQPFDAKLKGGIWNFDDKTMQAYYDPRTYSADSVVLGHARAAGDVRIAVSDGGGKAGPRTNKKAGGGGSSGRSLPPCPLCTGDHHYVQNCPKMAKCSNACCKGWHHRKGAPCDGGKERREWELVKARKSQQGQKRKGQALTATAAVATTATTPTVSHADHVRLAIENNALRQQLAHLQSSSGTTRGTVSFSAADVFDTDSEEEA